jgi:amino acid adenylation domain-containing protein
VSLPGPQAPEASPQARRRLLEELLRRKAARATRFPLSFAQQRLWFLYRMEPESSAYNLHRVLRVHGPLHPHALHRAVTELVRRHESLRTVFQEADGEPVQVIAAPTPVHPPVVDLRGLAAERRAEGARLAAADFASPFDLAAGPPLRVRVVWLEDEEWTVHLTVHHIVGDGWSMGLLLRELSALYDAYARGEPSPLPEPAMQYADYAVWQRDWLRGEVMERQLAYWKERLAGVPPLLELPTDRPRSAVLSGEAASVSFVLPAELTRALRAMGGREGATLFMVFLAGLQTLLARYSGQDVVAVGTPIAGRTRVELEALVGFFVNTLVLTADFSADPTFRELLGQVREATLGAYANQDVPFEKLVEELRVEPSLNHTPLYQVMLAFQNVEQGAPERAAAEPAPHRRGRDTATTDLSLTCRERGEHLAGALAYRTELFDAGTVERLLDHLGVLLEGIAADPGRRVSELPLLPDAERRRVLEEWNATAAPYPGGACIHEMFEARAERAPHATAVVLGEEALTYAELDRRAGAVASALAARGIGRGDYVPILMERSLGVPVAMLGVMKSGAAFSPLDVRWPAARLRQVLDDLGCEVVLVDGTTPFGAEELGRTPLDVRGGAGGEDAGTRPSVRVAPEDPVYAIYTSGSTGTPKGVLVPHRGIANRFLWMSEYFGPRAAEVVLQTTRHVYDSAVWQLFWPLTLGGRSVMLRGDEDLAAEPTAALVREHGVTMTDFVPSVFNEMVPRLVADAEVRSALASLRVVVVGGEQITVATAYTFREHFPGVRVVNLYGPTEASIGCICHDVTGREGRRIPIGRPIANTHALVLDRHRGLVPIGVPGELYLSGTCLGLGYLNDAEKTRAAFVENPFPELGCERMYRTGDRVRWLPGGEIEFLGRTDHQVKIRGFRIEPGEVEAALLRHPGVREALVLAREVAPGERRLVAYVAADGREGVGAAGLRAHLRAHLPEYMVPSAFVVLEHFPRTPGGKTDRGALPAPAWEGGAAYVAPRTPLEEILAEIWAGVLNRERVGVHDGFFELGGHSLLATRVIARVREAFGVEVPLRALFESPTVAGLGGRVQAAVSAGEGARPVPLRRVPRDGELPLSFGQERLWSAYRAEPGSTSFNLHHCLRLRGRLEPRALERALTEVVRRHEVLRTVFRMAGGRAVQVIRPARPVLLREVDLAGLPGAAREEAVRSLAAGEARRPFDLERGPLFRVLLARMGEGDFGLILSLHHIVTDGWSTGVLMREISTLYEAYAAGRESPLPDPEVQYADYAAWQRAWLSGEVLERQLAYWRAQLAGAPRLLALRTDRPRPPVRSDSAAVRRFRLPEEVSRALRSLGRREGCTLYMVLLAGFQALLSRHSGQEDVCVGTPIAGRTLREVESLIGFFTNTLVIRTDLSGSPTFRGLLSRVREATLGAYAHQDFPFARLVAELRPECGPGGMPLFQAVFELEHAPSRGERLRLPAVELGTLERSPEDRWSLRSELRLTMVDDGGRVGGSLAYRTELFDPATIERMVADYLALLEGAAADPDRSLEDLFPTPGALPTGSRTGGRSPGPSQGGRVAPRGDG